MAPLYIFLCLFLYTTAQPPYKYGPEFLVNNADAITPRLPDVTVLDNGDFIAVWTQEISQANTVFGRRYHPDGTPVELSSCMAFQIFGAGCLDPSVAALSNGRFVVVATCTEGYGQLFNSDCTKDGAEFQINSHTDNTQDRFHVASFTDDKFIVSWDSDLQDLSSDGVFGQLFSSSGIKEGEEFQINNYTSSYQRDNVIATLDNDNFVVCWTSNLQDDQDSEIYAQLFLNNGSKLGYEFRVNKDINDVQSSPFVTSLDDGFIVVWSSYSQDSPYSWGIIGQRFAPNGSKIGTEDFYVNKDERYQDQYDAQVARLGIGNGFVAVWKVDDDLVGNLYTENGSAIYDDFIIDNPTITSSSFTIVGLNSNNFVVLWEYSNDGGIMGQVYSILPISVGNCIFNPSNLILSIVFVVFLFMI